MTVQLDTGNPSTPHVATVERIETAATKAGEGFKRGLASLHAYRSDPSGGEQGSGDQRDTSEACPHSQQPARTHHDGASAGKALRSRMASRLSRSGNTRAQGAPPPPRARIGVILPLIMALTLVTGVANATDFADQAISTDRPGIPYGTSIVPVGHWQLETGLPTFENDPLPGGHSLLLSTPTYLRYGISDDFELQLAASPWNQLTMTQDGHRHTVSGAGDLQLGGKFALSSGGGAMPAVTLIGYVSAPTGSRYFSEDRPAYNLNAVASWSLTDSTSFTTMASFTRAPADGDRHANSGTVAASLSHSFTSQLTAYAETGWFPGYTNTSSTALAGGGVTYLVTAHVQVDGFFDVGLNRDSPTSVLGTGISILF